MGTTRYSVGEATLVRVPYADVLADAGVVALSRDQVLAAEWATPTWSEGDQVRVGAAVWIIESWGRRIAVDPAQAADDILRAGPDAAVHQEAFAGALAAAGYDRASIDTVVATHIDGIGMMAWRAGEAWLPFFPNAELLVSEREHAAIADGGPYRPSGTDAYFALHEQGVIRTVTEAHAVTSDVVIAWTGAHSPGHQIVNVTSGGEVATMIGHLALSPLHCEIDDVPLHVDSADARSALRSLGDGRLLIGPLWPDPGAVRWTGNQIRTAPPDD